MFLYFIKVKAGDNDMKEATFTKSISINLAEETYEKVKTITDIKKISISEWFRLAAELTLKKEREDISNEKK